ncbi:MAG: molybdopterin oxidoreductase [Betaproteobacteria bacterium RIFCSPLOWO2_12_FULL_62_58]|nr:MAG: molybdopterin oxidoreductase [Betaproteobacteria bacterium RIFCSPLOWO2_12_FULL_62_58]
MKLDILNTAITRRRFLQVSGVTGAAAATGLGFEDVTGQAVADAKAAAAESKTVITKSVCNQCPARCGVDVYTTDGRVHAMYGSLESPISNGKLCPKGYMGAYILYDPDRFKGPMKRTNPKKGRDEDPRFVPISWDEALNTVASRLQSLRDKGESHRFALVYGRGWGASDAGLLGDFAKLYGSPNVGLGHSSICADASKKAKLLQTGIYDYNAYDYANTNYMLIFGASFLEAYRPLNNNLQVWGHIRSKSPKTKVTAVDVHMNTTLSAADRALMVKPGTDGALALAIAHVILTEGLWERNFVGDFKDGVNRFKVGQATLDPAEFNEKWTKGLVEWWNVELKDRTPKWAAAITSIAERDIVAVARELATTKPAMVLYERGATSYLNGMYNGMAINALNGLIGSMYAEGGLMSQMGVPYGKAPVKADEFMDDYAKSDDRRKPRIDGVGGEWLMASNQIQAIAGYHIAGKPYKLDTIMFYMTSPIFSQPEPRKWEEALKDIFLIDTSPFPGETAMFADLVLPDHTYLERLQDAPIYPLQGWPMATLRVPAVKPLYDTKVFGDTLIEIGKRMKGPMGEYYKALVSTENVIKHLAKGFEDKPGTNGVNSFESWKEKGCWYKKPYLWRQVRGEFFEWEGNGYKKPMTPEEVKKNLLRTASGKFEFKASYVQDNEKYAAYIKKHLGVAPERVGFPQWLEPKYYGGGDLHFISPKVVLQAEGRAANLPHAIAIAQPVVGGKKTAYLEIHPETARKRGIADGDRVRIKSEVGSIEAIARYFGGVRPDVVVLPNTSGHWAYGRWAKSRLPSGSASEVIVNKSEPISGQAAHYATKVTVERV